MICFDNSHFLIFMSVGIGIILFVYYQLFKQYQDLYANMNHVNSSNNNMIVNELVSMNKQHMKEVTPLHDNIRDELPLGTSIKPQYIFNNPTRDYGYPQNTSCIGYVVALDDESGKYNKRMKLYGGRYDRYKYDYTVIDNDSGVQIPVDYKDEVSDGEKVKLMDDNKEYTIVLY